MASRHAKHTQALAVSRPQRDITLLAVADMRKRCMTLAPTVSRGFPSLMQSLAPKHGDHIE
jgi:hypothetical protein